MSKYPDISHHHPVGNWNKIKENCPFIISKATEGQTYIDPTLFRFIRNCEEKKIPYWLYTFMRRGNELEQAKFLVKTCKSKVGKHFIGYILDIESGNSARNVKEALKYINSLEYKTMIYTMYAEYDEYKDVIAGKGKDCAWWEARYGKNDGTYSSRYPSHTGVDLHQFTSLGKCPGISDRIDLNRLTGTKKLSWFTTKKTLDKEENKKMQYGGPLPDLPDRGYYKFGDGYKNLVKSKNEIKRLQTFLNLCIGSNLKVDGKYGNNTVKAVRRFQKMYNLKVDGFFGRMSLVKASNVKK